MTWKSHTWPSVLPCVWGIMSRTAGSHVIFNWSSPMDNLARCHARGVFFFLHADTCAWILLHPLGNVCWIKTKVSESSVAHKQPTCWNKTTDTHTPRHCYFHISAWPLIFFCLFFLHPLQSNIPDPIQPQRIVFILLTVFDIQSEIHGAEMAEMATSVHKQHQQKGYKIFMRLKTRMESTV